MSYNNWQQNDYPSGNSGAASSYYNDANNDQQQQYHHGQQQHGGYQQPPAYGQNQGYQNQGENEGQDGERGFMGAMAGGVAGAVGGGKLGGKATGHSKTSAFVGAIAGAFAGSHLQDAAHDWKEDRHDKKEEEKRREEEERRRREEERYSHDERHDDRRHDDRRDEYRHEDHHSSGSGSRSAGHFAGAFSGSSRDIRIDDDNGEWNLRASCRRGDGSYEYSTISLNRYLGNNNGSFQWVSPGSGGSGGGGAQSVTVQQGDTLRSIAARYGCSFEDIARHNNINNPDLIYPGQNLQIPGGGGNNNYNSNSAGGNFGASARDVRLTNDGQRIEASLCRQNGDWVTSSINLDERISNDNGTLRFI
ncbi:N-acetylmuramoyl-L-alanine amidase sle1 [Escovopsis weberi]|uniref:N-acetylmuramoyl-L-alanine amidase sle1 n=1 Tax=Escovopsis weberi TaxID=150374 RepID=A0A0M8MTG1_ESCWE|nr:N-acetylmuramoyl-L-alanine amidase sle1 [Escovopsis weberi]